jgi:hypothetical protein
MQMNDPASGGMIVREVDGELLILDTTSNQIHQLNETASLVWHMRREGATPQAIAAVLAADFAVDEAQALADVDTTLRRLESLKLLEGHASAESVPTHAGS